jgi:hypothetical protein
MRIDRFYTFYQRYLLQSWGEEIPVADYAKHDKLDNRKNSLKN